MNNLIRHFRGLYKEIFLRIRYKIMLLGVRKKNPIIVYQMGKVGSSTVTRTLKNANVAVPVIQVHTLSHLNFRNARNKVRKSRIRFLPEHLILSEYLIKLRLKKKFPCRIITLTREPISRAISFIFEDIRKQAPQALTGKDVIDLDKILKELVTLLEGNNGVADPTGWFDSELKAVFGIDIFQYSFDCCKKYIIIRNDDIELLLLRMEDLNEVLISSLSEFLKIPQNVFSISKANIGVNKWYNHSIKEVKERLKLSSSTIDSILDTKYVQYFYPAEKEKIRKTWQVKVVKKSS